jgi:hypothetical protein
MLVISQDRHIASFRTPETRANDQSSRSEWVRLIAQDVYMPLEIKLVGQSDKKCGYEVPSLH